MDCIFCKIVAGGIPHFTVYEDEHTLAFLDIHPRAKGHTVVIPRTHAKTLLELNDGETMYLFQSVKKTMNKIDDVLSPDGYTVGWNHGEAGGQAIDHVHIHILPRWSGDGGGNMHSIINNPSEQSVQDIAQLF